MRTTVTELGESRVRVEATVEADAVAGSVDRAAQAMARELKLPGFRKGKVPPALVVQRLGRGAVLEQALQDSLGEWYERALLEAGVNPIGDPKLDLPELPGEGEELAFTIEVGVRPKPELGPYRELEVGRAGVEVPADAVDRELDRLREGFASLTPVEREAAAGDVVLVDYMGTIEGEPFEGSEASDATIELGSEGLLEEFDRALSGARAGDEVTVEVGFADDHRPEELAGKTASFAVTVKEVRQKELPELDDEFASDASEFETIAELREAISTRLGEAIERRGESEYREAAVDAAVAAARLEIPHELVHARAHELWERIERQLAARGIDPQAYAQLQGKTRHELIDDAEEDAERGLRREAVLAAIADAEGIEVGDEEMAAALSPPEGEGGGEGQKLLAKLREAGRDGPLRDELRLRKAADLVVESAKPISLEQAAAREALWTPEKDEPAEKGRLWTPGEGL